MLGDCVVCRAVAKYKCSTCGRDGATCSVGCSKTHKTQHATSSGPASAPLTAHVAAAAAIDAHTQPAPTTVFEQKGQLDEQDLLQDYIFLSQMTRQVTSVGRELAQAGWARQGVEDSALVTHAGPAAAAELAMQKREREQRFSQRGGRPRGGRGGRVGAAVPTRVQARRDFFAKQARFLRIPLLLLPLGMEQAMTNRSGWMRKYVLR